MKKNKKWIKYRHRVIRNILYFALYPFSVWKYGIKIEKFKEQNGRQYLILLNHQTTFDQFFVGMAFKGPVYYLATEDIFSNGFVSALIRYLVAPIPIKKQTTDVKAVMNCIRVSKEGATIAIAPEGNRTYSGKTEYMNPAIASLAKKLKLPIALFKIEGGYGVQPRWSDVLRRGKMKAYVSRVVEPEEYEKLSVEELCALIEKELYVDDTVLGGMYYHKKSAEYLERAIYVCPECGLSEFHSHGDIIECKKCGIKVKYLPSKELEGVGFEFPFKYITNWYDYQCDFVNQLNTNDYIATPMYHDIANLSQVIVYKKKLLLREKAKITLYGNRIVIDENSVDEEVFLFDDLLAVSVLGRNKLNIYHGDNVYQFKGGKRFNALKYVNIYYRNKNITKETANGKFLGL